MESMDNSPSFEFVPPPSKLKSTVWKYFGFYKIRGSDETHYDRTLCKLCNNLLAYNGGCTTNMRYHIIRSHKAEAEQLLLGDVKGAAGTHVKAVSEAKDSKTPRRPGWLVKVDQDAFELVSPSSSLKALVWQYFGFYRQKGEEDTKVDRTWCKLCDHFLVYTGGNTSNMRSHLLRQHDIQLESLTGNSAVSTSECEGQSLSDNDQSQSIPDFTEKYEFVAPKPHLKALVWQYFGFYKKKDSDDTRFDRTCCKLCNTMLKYTGGCTTNMRNHLQRVHSVDVNKSEIAVTRTVKELKVSKCQETKYYV